MGVNRSLNKTGKPIDRDRVLGQAMRYDQLRAAAKAAATEQKKLASDIKEAAIEFGDEDGRSHVLKIGNYQIANRASVGDDIDIEAALQLLEEKGLVEDCTVRVLDKGAIEQCVQSGEISVAELETFMQEKVSYKVEVKKIK